MSGVLNLALTGAMVLGYTISVAAASLTGIATPFLFFGSILATVSAGLMFSLGIGSLDKLIAFQILGGLGWGLASPTALYERSSTIIDAQNDRIRDFNTLSGK